MRLTVAVLSSAALAVMCQICQSGQPALAQEQRSPLSGKISTFGAPAHTRLSREELSPFAAGGSELPGLHTLRALEPHGLLNGNVDSQSAQLLRGFGRMDRQMDRPPPFMGRAQNFNLGAQMQRHPGFAPYIWTQSKDGGYYDASGIIAGTVPGDQLRNYGGRFSDGTPVPTNDVGTNSSGHVWAQNGLRQPYFFTRNQSPF